MLHHSPSLGESLQFGQGEVNLAECSARVRMVQWEEVGREEIEKINLSCNTFIWDGNSVWDKLDKSPFFCRFTRGPRRVSWKGVSVAHVPWVRWLRLLRNPPLINVGSQKDSGQSLLGRGRQFSVRHEDAPILNKLFFERLPIRQGVECVNDGVRFIQELVGWPANPVIHVLEGGRDAVVACLHEKILGINEKRDGEKRGE